MIGFLIKKTLYDMWDNMFKLVMINLGFLAISTFPVFVPRLLGDLFGSFAVELTLTAVGILICTVYLATAAHVLKLISDYRTFGFGDFFKAFRAAWPAGIVMGLFVFALFLVVTVILPFYMSIESVIGLFLGMFIFWITIFALISFQYYYTIHARIGSSLTKTIRKCVIVSLDNSGFSLFLFIHNIAGLVVSVMLVIGLIFPGPAGILLYIDQAFRLRLLKYDWLEANPGADRRKIPWDAILIEEREKTGERTLKNFIFPWKD